MKRSDFLKLMGGGALGALAVDALTACKKTTTLDIEPPGENAEFTSTMTLSHTHTIVILKSDVSAPKAEGMTAKTSYPIGGYSGIHTHTFEMSQAQLQAVDNASSVTIETGSANAGDGPHTHWFTIQKWWH
jgi:hypothetical protein